MKKLIAGLMLCSTAVQAQEIIKYEFMDMDGQKNTVEAVLRVPKSNANKKALVILHHAGGWGHGTTTQYADLFIERGFVTLEPRMFNARPKRPTEYLGEVFGALKYLADQPSVDKTQISVMGLSLGGILTLISATDWANKKFTDGTIKFKSHAPFYPVCWAHVAGMKRTLPARFKLPKTPDDFEDKWIGSPMKIFAGTHDDYDDRDPNACREFIDAIQDEKQKSVTSVVMYEGATHGWDQQSRSFPEPIACKGKGCTNNNVNNPEITARAKEDLLKFLGE